MFEWNILQMSVKSIQVISSVSSLISLLSFCLVDLSIGKSELLMSLTIGVWGSMCDLSFSNISFTYVGALVFGA